MSRKRLKISLTLDQNLLKKLKYLNRQNNIPISRIIEQTILEKIYWEEEKVRFYAGKRKK